MTLRSRSGSRALSEALNALAAELPLPDDTTLLPSRPRKKSDEVGQSVTIRVGSGRAEARQVHAGGHRRVLWRGVLLPVPAPLTRTLSGPLTQELLSGRGLSSKEASLQRARFAQMILGEAPLDLWDTGPRAAGAQYPDVNQAAQETASLVGTLRARERLSDLACAARLSQIWRQALTDQMSNPKSWKDVMAWARQNQAPEILRRELSVVLRDPHQCHPLSQSLSAASAWTHAVWSTWACLTIGLLELRRSRPAVADDLCSRLSRAFVRAGSNPAPQDMADREEAPLSPQEAQTALQSLGIVLRQVAYEAPWSPASLPPPSEAEQLRLKQLETLGAGTGNRLMFNLAGSPLRTPRHAWGMSLALAGPDHFSPARHPEFTLMRARFGGYLLPSDESLESPGQSRRDWAVDCWNYDFLSELLDRGAFG